MKWAQETNWTGDQRVVKAVKGFVPDSEDSFSKVRIYNEEQDNVKFMDSLKEETEEMRQI